MWGEQFAYAYGFVGEPERSANCQVVPQGARHAPPSNSVGCDTKRPARSDLSKVDFLIDGRSEWVEHSAPYYYGSDGNFLVTSFLSAGSHTFTVKATTIGCKTASTTETANVAAAPAPPSALVGSWKRLVKHTDPTGPPSGYWHLVINRFGWKIYDTSGGANVLDVAYLKPGVLEVRTGMATGHDRVVGAVADEDLNVRATGPGRESHSAQIQTISRTSACGLHPALEAR